jgi:pimeloyl-ACP methyl ester carboxylesterase
MPKINIDGVDIYYEIHGEGEPLVLMHHGMGSSRMWDKLLPGFAEKYKVIVYDRRGFGQSGKEDFRDYYRGDDYVPDSVGELSLLLRCLDINEKVFILGQCEAGVTGFHYAAENPEGVKAIAISSTMCCSRGGTPQPSLPSESRERPSFDDADPEFRKKVIYWQGESYAPELFSLFLEGGGAYGTGSEPFDLRDTLKQVQCPAMVLYPDRSRLFDVEQAVMMYRQLPAGELAVLPYCGHNTYEHQPEEYQRIILSFFARHV